MKDLLDPEKSKVLEGPDVRFPGAAMKELKIEQEVGHLRRIGGAASGDGGVCGDGRASVGGGGCH